MVPSGLKDDDNKYYEYVVIILVDDEGIETRFLEKVGSWNVELDNYVTNKELT
jgi:hypothetical protein